MSKIIKLEKKFEAPPDNLITSKPWEFRRADWESKHFIQMLKSQSAKLEMHREEIYKRGDKGVWHLPAHFSLRGGMAYTIQGIYTYRTNEGKMREVYYLAGLIDCMINQVNPLLRTDLIRDMYKKVITHKKELNISWYGQLDQVLFPVDDQFYSSRKYRQTLASAKTMKELYDLIREGIDEVFDILSLEYVFYSPGRGG
ncbi:MAG: hypothetical protein JSW15_00650 [Deltaproteobacteria bacterium]|nr:MAG: hypothetical protein JSW15_00650 [Deltaproteobacteria bacterium]